MPSGEEVQVGALLFAHAQGFGHGVEERAMWRMEAAVLQVAPLRNSAGHTVAHASYDARYDTAAIADRVAADLGIYFSWLVKDALVRRDRSAYTAVVIGNPAHARVLADLDRPREQERGDG
jgi:hypothetical protein